MPAHAPLSRTRSCSVKLSFTQSILKGRLGLISRAYDLLKLTPVCLDSRNHSGTFPTAAKREQLQKRLSLLFKKVGKGKVKRVY